MATIGEGRWGKRLLQKGHLWLPKKSRRNLEEHNWGKEVNLKRLRKPTKKKRRIGKSLK